MGAAGPVSVLYPVLSIYMESSNVGLPSQNGERCPAAGQAAKEISNLAWSVIFLSPGSYLPRLSLPRSHIMTQDIKCSKSHYLIWRHNPKSWG